MIEARIRRYCIACGDGPSVRDREERGRAHGHMDHQDRIDTTLKRSKAMLNKFLISFYKQFSFHWAESS